MMMIYLFFEIMNCQLEEQLQVVSKIKFLICLVLLLVDVFFFIHNNPSNKSIVFVDFMVLAVSWIKKESMAHRFQCSVIVIASHNLPC